MSYKKSFLPFILIPSLLTSCSSRKSLDLFDESLFWITDNSQIVINNYYPDRFNNNNPLEFSPYVMYNYKNSGYTLCCWPPRIGALIRSVSPYIYISNLNGSSQLVLSTCEFSTPKRIDKTQDYIPIIDTSIHHYEEISDEEKEKIESFFSEDTKIIKKELKDVYLINRCDYFLSNDDIKLSASDTQFSFSTGIMKDEKEEDINIILKCTSNTTFKIYKFENREAVGDILLEGTMSSILKEEEGDFYIDFKITSDYYFNGKYSDFKLYIDQDTDSQSKSNYYFIFPKDID